MTDRELLELAAKAADLDLKWQDDKPHVGDWLSREWWNPLNDDGDALRLAVKHQMTVAFGPNRGSWSVGAIVNGEFTYLAFDEDCRRAIVRAAAEIGKGMK